MRDKARRAAQHSSRRAAAQNSKVPGIDKRWGWLEEQMFVDIRSAVYPGACVAPPPLALSARNRRATATSQAADDKLSLAARCHGAAL